MEAVVVVDVLLTVIKNTHSYISVNQFYVFIEIRIIETLNLNRQIKNRAYGIDYRSSTQN